MSDKFELTVHFVRMIRLLKYRKGSHIRNDVCCSINKGRLLAKSIYPIYTPYFWRWGLLAAFRIVSCGTLTQKNS